MWPQMTAGMANNGPMQTSKNKMPRIPSTRLQIARAEVLGGVKLHGAHVTHFQKNGEPPLLFLSRKSHFAPGKAIRGGVPICFPWFGNREGEPSHGFARTTEWELVKTSVAADGAVTLQLALPEIP